jgi:hypothetical protein
MPRGLGPSRADGRRQALRQLGAPSLAAGTADKAESQKGTIGGIGPSPIPTPLCPQCLVCGRPRFLCCDGKSGCADKGTNKLVPFLHTGALLGHIGPAVVALRAHVLKSVVLDAVANFLRHAGFTGERLPRAAQVAGREGNDPAFALTPHEGVEGVGGHRSGRILGRRKEPAVVVGHD